MNQPPQPARRIVHGPSGGVVHGFHGGGELRFACNDRGQIIELSANKVSVKLTPGEFIVKAAGMAGWAGKACVRRRNQEVVECD